MTATADDAGAKKWMLYHEYGRAGRSRFDPPLTGRNGSMVRNNAGAMAGNMRQQERPGLWHL